jgi:outer membrane protein OmpA-like peptidoglycan-associated protein/tetratricopeptide (TPR) repeat protein
MKRYLLSISLLLFFLVAFSPGSFTQNKLADKANEHFKYNQFAEAANLYEQALRELAAKGKPERNTGALKAKLAYCYRMNNKMDKAEALYADLVTDEKAKAETFLFYAEALMSNEKYAEAKKWLLHYQRLEPAEEKGRLLLDACDKVPFIQPYFPYVEIEEFTHNSPADDNGPVAWQNGIVFSSDRNSGIKLMKEKSGWTGRDYLDLYLSEKNADGTFAAPKQFSSRLSEVRKNTGNASFTADGSEVFFTRNDNELNKQKTYNLQLFSAQATASGERWKSVDKLPFCSSAYNFMHPAISPDGQWLFFASNKGGGQGGTDLWVSQRTKDGWEKPENLGETVNTPANEGFPFVDAEGRLFFCSKGLPGFGGFDIFVTEKDGQGNWKTPLNLGKPINSSLDDISIYIAPDRQSGMFTSSRSGGDDDIYLFWVLDHAPATAMETPAEPVPVEVETEEQEAADETAHEEIPTRAELPQEVFEAKTLEIDAIPSAKKPEEPTPPTLADVTPPVPASGQPVASSTQPPAQESRTEPGIPGTPILEIPPVATEQPAEPVESVATTTLASFGDFEKKAKENTLREGDCFRLDSAVYDGNVWQITPRVSAVLDKLVRLLRLNPSLCVEICAHTEALGIDEDNLRLSQNRAQKALEYLVREDIAEKRLSSKGYGETMPLNHCRNGVTCSLEEHLFNQRLEVKVVKVEGRR